MSKKPKESVLTYWKKKLMGDVVEDVAVSGAAKAATGLLKFGIFGKVIVVVVVGCVIVGTVYYIYNGGFSPRDKNADGNNVVVADESPTPSPNRGNLMGGGTLDDTNDDILPDSTFYDDTINNNTDDASNGEDVDDVEVGGELSGTFLDETGTVSLAFSDGTVILDFPTDGYTIDGTYTAEDGILTLHFNEWSPMFNTPIPYEMKGGNLILDGALYTKQ